MYENYLDDSDEEEFLDTAYVLVNRQNKLGGDNSKYTGETDNSFEFWVSNDRGTSRSGHFMTQDADSIVQKSVKSNKFTSESLDKVTFANP